MRITKAWPLIAVAILLFANDTLGFTSMKASHLTKSYDERRSLVKRNVLGIDPTEIDNEPPASSVTANTDGKAKEIKAVESLERLLVRQEAEIKETKRLLSLYKNTDQLGHADGTLHHHQDGPSEILSVASSIMEGFNYGFQSRSEGSSFDDLKGGGSQAFNKGYGPPANLLTVGSQQFMRNLNAMRDEYEDEEDVELTAKQIELRDKLEQLTLNSTEIWARETKDGPIEAPFAIKIPYFFLCYLIDNVFEDKYVPSRFFFLETVARMPYFSYITMLHLYESLGFWRRSADMKRIHFAEEMNEFNHLLIMESLGGDQRWWVRWLAQHSAIAYFVGLNLLWALSPTLSYKFSELLETHAVNSYGTFLDENEELLKELPPSLAAVDYYSVGASDPYYAEFQTTAMNENIEMRRPGLDMKSLYDVFTAIRDDESDHVSTMEACMDPNVANLSPSLERKALTAVAAAVAISLFLNTGVDSGMTKDIIDTIDADGIDFAATETITSGLADAAIAGMAGILSNLGQDSEETIGLAGLFASLGQEAEEGLLEEGAILSLRSLLETIFKFLR